MQGMIEELHKAELRTIGDMKQLGDTGWGAYVHKMLQVNLQPSSIYHSSYIPWQPSLPRALAHSMAYRVGHAMEHTAWHIG